MTFDKSRIFTAVNADELKVGSKVILAESLEELKDNVECNRNSFVLNGIKSDGAPARFFDGVYSWFLAYLVEEPEEKKLQWTDLKVGDIITDDCVEAMVIQINKYNIYDAHILAGNIWLTDEALEKWKKVE